MIHTFFKFLLLTIFSISVIVGIGFYLQQTKETITLVHPQRGPVVQAVYATGTVEPVIMLPVAPRISSRLMEILVDEGSHVEKNTILARLEDTDIRKDLIEAQTRVNLAKKEYDRQAALVKSGAVSRQSFDQANAEVESAQALVEKIEASLSYMTLLAPDNGTVIRRDGEIGELITAGQPVFWLAGKEMRIEAEVDEEDIALVKPGQKTLIHADAFPGEIFKGTVKSITPKGDPIARSYRVRITLQSNTKLMIGMTAECNIVIREEENALLVPVSAVQNDSIWIFKDDQPLLQPVKTGAANSNAVEIIEGVTETDFVIQDPPADLEEKQDIQTQIGNWNLQK